MSLQEQTEEKEAIRIEREKHLAEVDDEHDASRTR